MAADLRKGFRLGPYSIEPLRGAVTRPDGESHHLEPKVMSVLVYLAENANQPVMREEILDAVWAGQVAADELLTRAVSELRRVLGDPRANPKFIETIPKKGYRLIGTVESQSRSAGSSGPAGGKDSPDDRRKVVPAISIVSAVLLVVAITVGWYFSVSDTEDTAEETAAIAIFPFQDLSPNSSFPGVARVISNGIAHRLHRTEGVRLLSLDYIEVLLKEGFNNLDIGARLNATHLLTGSYLISGDDFSWTAELTLREDATVLWSSQGSDSLRAILSIQSGIAEEVAVSTDTVIRSGLATVAVDVEPKAFSLHSESLEKLRAGRLEEAIDLLTEAVQIDPTYAEARADLARSQVSRSWILVAPRGLIAQSGEQNALEALRTDPNLDAALGALAMAKSNQNQWSEARRYLDQMLDNADPAQISSIAVPVLGNLGHWKRAIEVAEQMVKENPYGPGYGLLVTYYAASGQHALAKEAEELAIAHGLGVDGIRMGVVYGLEGNRARSTDYLAAESEKFGYTADIVPLIVDAFATGEISAELQEAFQLGAAKDEAFEANLVYWYSLLHFPADEVFELAKRLTSSNRLNQIAFFSDRASRYRSDPRFVEIMEDIGIAAYWREVELPDFCELIDGELACH